MLNLDGNKNDVGSRKVNKSRTGFIRSRIKKQKKMHFKFH